MCPTELRQLSILRHALGLKDPVGEGEPYRNHFASHIDGSDYNDLNEMVAYGYMIRKDVKLTDMDGIIYYSVTEAGKRYVNESKGMNTGKE